MAPDRQLPINGEDVADVAAKPLVLVCDDEPPIRRIVRTLLEKNDFEVLEASNGQTALALARQRLPNLILLDSMMPHLSGLDCLNSLRHTKKTQAIPVMMLTAKKDPQYIQQCIRHGIQGYVAKPFKMDVLLDKIRAALGQNTSTAD